MGSAVQKLLKLAWVQKRLNPEYGKRQLEPREKICIVPGATSRLGDLVMNNHFIKQLRRTYEVCYLVPEHFYQEYKDFLDNHCLAERLLVLPCRGWKQLQFISYLRKENIKAAVLLPHSPPPIDACCFMAGIPVICGTKGTSAYVSHYYNYEKFKHSYHYTHVADGILDALRCPSDGVTDNTAWFPYVAAATEPPANPAVVSLAVHVGGEAHWIRKWPFDKYIKICILFLNKYNGVIYLVGGRGKQVQNERFKQVLVANGYAEDRVINCSTATLNGFADILSKSDIFLGNDSGPMYVATAMKRRVVCIFGPSDVHFVSPTEVDASNQAIRADRECVACLAAPASKPNEERPQCSCLNNLPVAKVWEGLMAVAEETISAKATVENSCF